MYVLKNLSNLDKRPIELQEKIFENLFKTVEVAKLTQIEVDEYERSLFLLKKYNNYKMKIINCHYLILGLLLGLLFSCDQNQEKANMLLTQAQSYYDLRQYAGAKLLLDSLDKTYPKEITIRKEGLHLMRTIELDEQIRNIAFCDSMLIEAKAQVEILKPQFVFEKDAEYDEFGKYIVKQQILEKNLRKTYIRCGVNELGEMFIASVYYGTKAINHNQLKVVASDGSYAETQIVPRDGALNYSFSDGGMVSEIVTYSQLRENGVAAFIYSKTKEKLKAELMNETSRYSFFISDADKRSLVTTRDLATALLNIVQLGREIEKSKERIRYLNERIKK